MSFLDGLGYFYDASLTGQNETEEVCPTDIDHYRQYQFTLIPAVIISFLFASTRQRRQKLLSVMDGRPGLLYPMDTLTRSSRISYACAFGATAFLIYQIMLEQKFAINYDGPVSLKSLIAILSMFIYGMVFFPLFACLALGTAFSYGLGSLYAWMFFTIDIYRLSECPNLNAEGRVLRIVRNLPGLLCHMYLSISIPIRFCVACYKGKWFTASMGEDPYDETLEEVQKSFQGRHVSKLLRKHGNENIIPPVGYWNKFKSTFMTIIEKIFYKRTKGFRYPARILSVMFVAAIVVYVLTVEFMVEFVTLLTWIEDVIDAQIKLVGFFPSANEETGITDYREALKTSLYIAEVIKACIIVTICVATAISFTTILHMMSSFRENLLAMYRADYRFIPSPYEKSGISLCVGSIKYAGFQVAYIVWAYIISCLVIFTISMILAIFILLLKYNIINDWVLNKLLQTWPGLLVTIVLLVVQNILAKYLFLQGRGEWLRLDNRRFFFIFTYFMFWYNIFLGFISCLLRIIKAMVIGIIFLARLDNSTLPRKFEFFDPGFSAYQGFIHMESSHTHPVVIVFIRLLAALRKERQRKEKNRTEEVNIAFEKDDTKEDTKENSNHASEGNVRPINAGARFQWLVTYTLLTNPGVRVYRKGYMQALQIAHREGLRIPISDKPVSDFDLVKSQEEREKEREVEVKKIKEDAEFEKSKKHKGKGLHALVLGKDDELIEETSDSNIKISSKNEKKGHNVKGWLKKKLSRDENTHEKEQNGHVVQNEAIEIEVRGEYVDKNDSDDQNNETTSVYL